LDLGPSLSNVGLCARRSKLAILLDSPTLDAPRQKISLDPSRLSGVLISRPFCTCEEIHPAKVGSFGPRASPSTSRPQQRMSRRAAVPAAGKSTAASPCADQPPRKPAATTTPAQATDPSQEWRATARTRGQRDRTGILLLDASLFSTSTRPAHCPSVENKVFPLNSTIRSDDSRSFVSCGVFAAPCHYSIGPVVMENWRARMG
jgi:hypothetical protein